MTVLAANNWPTNGHMIADVAKLGYLNGNVLDPTYGMGTFWKVWQPAVLQRSDIKPRFDNVLPDDFTYLPWPHESFEAVVFDPPYKLNGTPDDTVDGRYGVHEVRTAQQRIDLMLAGVPECGRVARRHLLVKCQDQVCSGRMWWQTDLVTEAAEKAGFQKVDRFDLLGNHRRQPMEGRKQKHAHGRPSTLLVFRRRA